VTVAVAFGLGLFVAALDQQPAVAALARGFPAHAHQHPALAKLLSIEDEFEGALPIGLRRVGIERRPPAAVPQHGRPAAVLALGDHPSNPPYSTCTASRLSPGSQITF
jgi:hypothetical protein